MPKTDLKWERHHELDATVIVFIGELDLATAAEALDILIDAIREGNVVVDASRVTFMDASGIGSLVDAYREANRGVGEHRTVTVRDPSVAVRRVLQITGLDRFIEQPNAL